MDYLGIKNFKCFQNTKIPLQELTVLAGANGNGKSTAIQALLFLRKTIENNFNLDGDQYQVEPKEMDTQVALNEDYMLMLGNSGYVINRLSNSVDLELEFAVEHGRTMINYVADATENSLYISACKVQNSVEQESPILKKTFYYLNAERIGPRASQFTKYFPFPHVGYQGEYTAQMIATENYRVQIEESRRHPAIQSPRLEQQVNAWLDDMMPGVRITSKLSPDTLTAQILIENDFIKGDPTLATNIGFGISYILPVIATGLIAQKGSIFIVENPEAHLHPSAQSKIGRFLAMLAQAGVKVVIETHSDHVINGIQIAVAKDEVDFNKVMINFFFQGESSDQPEIEHINLNKIGELSKWPRGFFDQSQVDFGELFKLRKR